MRVRFWGTRGSIATPGPETLHFGGNTSCIEVTTDSGQRFILDCGTGARPLGRELMTSAPRPVRATLLIGHTHWDHIQGFPFFAPFFVPENEFTICAPAGVGRSLDEVLRGQMEFTYFPVELGQLPARIEYREMSEGTYEWEGTRVITQYLNHPAVALGYRIEADGAVVVYVCDHEPFGPAVWREGARPGRMEAILHDGDRRHASFMKHADLLIHDAQYTPDEYADKKNWGHSTYEYVVELAAASDVRQLALTHHDPGHDDAALRELQDRALALARQRNFLLHVFCAYEGCEITVQPWETERTRTVSVAAAASVVPSRVRILVVDDDPNLRMLVSAALIRDGYAVIEAGDGEEGWRCVEKSQPHVVLLDVNMPRLDGISLLKRLRQQSSTRELPILMLTARGDADSTREAFDAGATDYLAKPFTIPQLAARLQACMARVHEQGIHPAND